MVTQWSAEATLSQIFLFPHEIFFKKDVFAKELRLHYGHLCIWSPGGWRWLIASRREVQFACQSLIAGDGMVTLGQSFEPNVFSSLCLSAFCSGLLYPLLTSQADNLFGDQAGAAMESRTYLFPQWLLSLP